MKELNVFNLSKSYIEEYNSVRKREPKEEQSLWQA
jgi:hypothetical protein